MSSRKFRLATRNSQLALVQTHEIIQKLVDVSELGLSEEDFEIVEIANAQGDVNLTDPLYNMGQIGVFTKSVEIELKQNRADIAVHSLKDLPTICDSDLIIAAIPELMPRGDIVILNEKYSQFEQLNENHIIGTSSLRRTCCLKYHHKNLNFQNIRGNLNTRLKKLKEGQYDAIILANAGVKRLKWEESLHQLDQVKYLYAPGQGALGVQCRADDEQVKKLLSYIDVKESRIRVEAERQFLNKLEGGCKLPIGVYSEIISDELLLVGQVWDRAGEESIRDQIRLPIGDKDIGSKLADLMRAKGADKILQKIQESLK